ncbi:MAG: hypothetical protein OXP08_07710, partial [bacterium]|nr:hypothetical protein [bacterium]
MTALAMAGLLASVVVSVPVAAQDSNDLSEQDRLVGIADDSMLAARESSDGTGEVRIAARRLADGRIEFGLEQHQTQGWGDVRLPRQRLFPVDARAGRWLAGSPLTLTGGDVRIAARRLADGRVEVGLQVRDRSTWSDRQLPRLRFVPTGARVGRWIASSPLLVTAPASAEPFSAVTAGVWHSCGLRTDATVTCWGSNHDSSGSRVGQATPRAGTFSAVTAGAYHSCGLRTDGTITCWGTNSMPGAIETTGQAAPPGGHFSAVAAGGFHSCGLRTDSTVTCWGANHAPFSRSPGEGEYLGQADAPRGHFSAVTAGLDHSCGLRTDNTITCWGANNYGHADAPAGHFSAVAAGGTHSCGLRTDGTITCWGANNWGQ